MLNIDELERERLEIQARLDSEKTQAERNRMGQFATPTALACDLLRYAKRELSLDTPIRFLDPALGTGSFYSAFLRIFGEDAPFAADGFEIDGHYGEPSRDLWQQHGLNIRSEDFTAAVPPENDADKATLLICNPPYVRHHHISAEDKRRLHDRVAAKHGIALSGLSGLYCYFLCLSKEWMASGGLAAWLIPSEFMDVNYGRAVKDFLLNKVTLLHIHRFSPADVQFGDALVSSAIVWFRNESPAPSHTARFSLGGSLLEPSTESEYPLEQLHLEKKWTSLPQTGTPRQIAITCELPEPVLGDFFSVKRGIATGANNFFIMSLAEAERRKIPKQFLTPILPSPRYLATDRIENGKDGVPAIEKLGFLFSSALPEERIQHEYPDVWKYLEEGRERGVPEGYICRNRYPWYQQERREAPMFLCTYMGRTNGNGTDQVFRFILNHSNAVAANVYLLLYPKPWVKKELQANPHLAEEIWAMLQSIPVGSLIGEGRVYGGGLHKLEPKELLNVPAEKFALLFSSHFKVSAIQMTLF
ncbi:MAG: SAM-dependent DNA methyltransferase [Candidatus Hydrogenedentes bacterium]|nr:SAM-dependent DNA methyltransferase [Candidatus Hydrogenedentota bacterium]